MGHKDGVQMTFGNRGTTQQNLMHAISLTCSSPKMCGPGVEGAGGPGGRAKEEATGFYFCIPPCSPEPLGCLSVLSSPPSGARR